MKNPLFPMRKLVLIQSAIVLLLFAFLMVRWMVGNNIVYLNVSEMYDKSGPSSFAHSEKTLPIITTPHKDVIDDSGASLFLQRYSKSFGGEGHISEADPQRPETVTQWWEAAAMIDWYINTPLRYQCKNKVSYGNWHVCQDEPYIVKEPCLVYSFGIAFDFSFDDAMGRLGCEVHSFDPSMGKNDSKRNENVTFHNMGLSIINTNSFHARKDIYVKENQFWKLRTLKSVMRELGHSQRVIDVLKLDIEGYEWGVMNNLMETGVFEQVRHLILEIHLFPDWPPKEDYVLCYNVYRRLREMGFREYSKRPHRNTLQEDKFNNQGDSEFINAYFKY